MAGKSGRTRIVVHGRSSAFGRALPDSAWSQSIGRRRPSSESWRRNGDWQLVILAGETHGVYRSRLTDPAFPGSVFTFRYLSPGPSRLTIAFTAPPLRPVP